MTDPRVPIYPADQLLAWLDHHASDPATLDEVPVRLPVLVVLTDNRMDVATATVGDASDALAIAVDDRTLGIPIAGKLPMFFGEGAATGMLWLQGLWRGGPKRTFQVTRVEAAITPPERGSATTAEITE